MSFLYHHPDDVREKIRQNHGPSPQASMFGYRDEYQQDNLTEQGIALLQWLNLGKAPSFRQENRWLEPIDSIAVLCFGADYDLFRQEWPTALQSELDAFYGPVRCNTFLPKPPASGEFDGALLNAIGVQFIYSPDQCYRLFRLGSEHPFVALFAELIARKGSLPPRLESRLAELLSNAESRDLLCRYDAIHQELRAAYSHAHVTRKHLLVTNYW